MILSLVLARNPRLKTILHGEKKEFVTGMLRAEEQVLVIFICGYTISVGVFFFFFFFGHAMQYARSSPTRDQTHAPYIGNVES